MCLERTSVSARNDLDTVMVLNPTPKVSCLRNFFFRSSTNVFYDSNVLSWKSVVFTCK